MIPKNKQPRLIWKQIPGFSYDEENILCSGHSFGCVSMLPDKKQLIKHPLTIVALVPKEAALFAAGAISGAAAKTVTAPLDRIKLIMQTHGLRAGHESAKKTIGFIEAVVSVGKEEGVKGYWKGNLAQVLFTIRSIDFVIPTLGHISSIFSQVIRILPYSAVQLFAYESYKKLFRGEDGELSVFGRLAAGASAGMTSTFVTYPLDVLRLRMAVDPGHQTMSNVVVNMLKEEGFGSLYRGLVPSLISIAPYVAVNFCVFDLVKKSLPERFRERTEASLLTAFVAATVATVTCYPLDTIRRQMQMRATPYKTVLDAFPGIIARDGVIGLYRGFVPNALKTLPNSSIRLTAFDAMKRLIAASEIELQRMLKENSKEHKLGTSSSTS